MTRMARSGNTWRTWKTPIQLACDERRYQDLERHTSAPTTRPRSKSRPPKERDNPGAPPGIAHYLTVLGPHAARAEGKETRVDGWEDGLRAPTLERNAVELVTTISTHAFTVSITVAVRRRDAVRLAAALPVYRIRRRYSLGTNTMHPVLARQRKNARRHAQARAQGK
ncbi:hypothetical protein C8F01DRAFT_1373580 [Mycena amicta]|nr:hypothetical protein C8F01DRAFT_1373580 [Mycena amicta]